MSTKKIKLFLNDPELSQKCTFEKHTFDTPRHYDPCFLTKRLFIDKFIYIYFVFIFNLYA